VASNNAWILIAFRGTETRRRSETQDFQHILADIKADFNILLVDSGHHGKVHQGFHNALDEIWDDLLGYLTTLDTAQRPLWITGHSLGAALATLAAGRYHNVQGVYTFGSPRVGDADFRRHFSVRTYRVVHNNDIVTGVPLPGLYRHVGELWYIDSDGVLQQPSERYEMWMDGVRGEMRNITHSVEQATQGTYNYVPGGLKDHVPLLYAIHLWNNMHSRPGITT
jgi:predicted lipase